MESSKIIQRHYEECLEKHGACAKGMDWPDEKDLEKRFEVMVGAMRGSYRPASLLDLGCGAGLLIDYLKRRGLLDGIIKYKGIDLSPRMIEVARECHPAYRFEIRDILTHPLREKSVDYVIINGLLTEKLTLKQREMESFACRILQGAYDACRVGIAFNVMNSHVDWKRKDLFHWPLDRMTQFLVSNCSRSIVIRMDYGLYEYTVYVYREPTNVN